MSDESKTSSNKIADLIGKVFLFLIPASLIVMLGFVGVAFLGGANDSGKPEEVAPEQSVAKAETAPAPADSSPAPGAVSEEETPEPASAEGGEGSIDPAVMALGKTSYATCAACHGPDGKGMKAGPMVMAPSLVGSELLLGDPDKSLLVILKGIEKQGMDYVGAMAPLAAALDDEKLAAVLTYVRNEWGNSAPPVTVAQAAAARKKFADVEAPAGVKRDEIDKIVAEHK